MPASASVTPSSRCREGLFGIPGIVEEEKDAGIVYEISLGANFILSKKMDLGLEYRDLHMDGDFDTLSGGTVDIGGKIYALVLRFYFPA